MPRRQPIPGSCRDYVTAGQWVAVHNSKCCVTLACPDDPLFQIGAFNFGKELQTVPRETPPVLLSWAMTNYYNVNFRGASQPDSARFRYELTTQPRYDVAVSTAAGAAAAQRLEVHPVVKLNGPVEGRLAEVNGEGIILQGIRNAADGHGLIAVVSNVTDAEAKASIRFPHRSIRQAWRCGTLEENREELSVTNGGVSMVMAPCSVATIRLVL